jgi:2,3-bisphosphoglycerate-dependent phosphoglycerate mutase
MELLLVRHALPLRVEREDGQPADPPLSELGAAQADRLADWLLDEPEVHALYVSPLRRARETAAPLADRLALEPVVEEGVAEFDRDSDAYVPMEELKATDYDRWLEMVSDHRSMAALGDPFAFRELVSTTLERIISDHRGQRVAVVCHGGVINAFATYVLGLDDVFVFDPNYTSITRFLGAGTGERSIVSLNETAHLRGLGAVASGHERGSYA